MRVLDRPGRILAFRNDRLGARLITMINAMRIARSHDLPFAVHWIIATDIGSVFNDPKEMFAAELVDRHFIDRDAWVATRDDAVRIGNVEKGGVAAVREVLASGRDVLVDAAFGITVLGDEDPAVVESELQAILLQFPFAESLRPTVEEIDRAVGGGTAYHIRRGDLTSFPRAMHRSWPKKYVPDEIYMVHMEREMASGARPVVFSDDPGAVARFKAAYPALLSVEDVFDTSHLTPAQRDLMELYAMSRARKIIAPEQSAFSSTAAELGRARKVDVMEDLAEEERAAALDRLAARLATVQPEDATTRKGDNGQSFLHAIEHLQATGRAAEAADCLRRHVAAGLDISFLYPRLIEMQLLLGQPEAALESARIMRSRVLYHRQDFANGEVLHGIAHAATGDREAAIRHISNGYWHEPDTPLTRTAVGLMVETGLLDEINFLPFSPMAQKVRRRMARDAVGAAIFAPLRALAPERAAAVTSIPGLDPLGWDWGPFMRAFSAKGVARHAHRAGFEKALAKQPPGPDSDSLGALFALLCDDETALPTLEGLGERHPDDPLVMLRLSRGLHIARKFRPALEACAAAVAAAPGVPALDAWHGVLLGRAKQFDEAVAAFRTALSAGLTLPTIRAQLAQVLTRAGAQDAALAELDLAVADAPGEQAFRFARAELHAAAGRQDAALADLDLLEALDKRAPKVVRLHDEVRAALGIAEPERETG